MNVKGTSLQAVLFFLSLATTSIAQGQLPQGPGKEIVESSCGVCHDVDTAIGTRRTKAAWQEAIDAMVNRGARVTDEEITIIVEYLTNYFGVLNVNKATGKELETVLEISAEKAQAIVQYRTKHGDFKDLDALKKVPGVDAKVIEERKDRVAFK